MGQTSTDIILLAGSEDGTYGDKVGNQNYDVTASGGIIEANVGTQALCNLDSESGPLFNLKIEEEG